MPRQSDCTMAASGREVSKVSMMSMYTDPRLKAMPSATKEHRLHEPPTIAACSRRAHCSPLLHTQSSLLLLLLLLLLVVVVVVAVLLLMLTLLLCVVYLTSQQHAKISQGRICSDDCMTVLWVFLSFTIRQIARVLLSFTIRQVARVLLSFTIKLRWFCCLLQSDRLRGFCCLLQSDRL